MKKYITLALLAVASLASAQTYVQPHYRSNGTYVEGYYRSAPSSGSSYGTGSSSSSTYVQPHYTNSGTYVEGHRRTTPDSTTLNNYGTSGNFNPYTGSVGTRNPCTSYGCQ